MVGVCKTLLFADQLVKISIVNVFPYHFRAECPDPVSQLSFRSLLPSPSYLPASPFSPLVHSGEQLDILL